MKLTTFSTLARIQTALIAIVSIAFLSACASGPEKPKPADLGANVSLLDVRLAWSVRLGEVAFALQPAVNGNTVTLAGSDGGVLALQADTGQVLWRGNVGAAISAGVGSDGKLAAVVTQGNQVVTLQAGRELWRQKLPAQAFTAPLVAGERVFVLAADRSVSAFDGASGRKLWSQQRPAEPLVLRQSGVLLAVGDTLVVGLSGRLVGLNPQNGSQRWQALIGQSRGINDVERLVDLVGPASRVGDVVCVRAFQAAVGCVDASRGELLWTRSANGAQGLGGNAEVLVGIEGDGKLQAWRRRDGEPRWSSERLRYRSLSAPLLVGRSLAIGDGSGLLHLLAQQDGSPLNRLPTDASALVVTPTLAGNTIVVVTRQGGVYGFTPQ